MRPTPELSKGQRERPSMETFLAGVERRAYRMAEIATGNREDALDIVQDAMLKLVRSYGRRPASEWPALFHRILQNRILDWHRRGAVRRRVMQWLGGGHEEAGEADPVGALPDPAGRCPAAETANADAMAALEQALRELPPRQQQAFLLRAWEGLDVAATAAAMGCAQGSVKTHYHRAVQALRRKLGEHWT